MSVRVAIPIAAVAIVGVVGVLHHRAGEARLAALAHSVEQMREQRATFDARPTLLAESPNEVTHANPVPSGGGVDSVPTSEPSAPKAVGPTRQHTEGEMHDHFEATFVSDRHDATWSRSFSRSLGERLSAHPSTRAAKVRNLDCRESLCRVEMEHRNREAYDAFVSDALLTALDPAWNAASFTTIVEGGAAGGAVVAVSYVARDGEALPALE